MDIEGDKGGAILTCFESRTSPNPIMNILIWNCRGAMKPTFQKTALDLVEWHWPIIFVMKRPELMGLRLMTLFEGFL